MYVHKTPPNPPQNTLFPGLNLKVGKIHPKKTPFPGLNLKVGKMNYSLDNLDPKWAKCVKSGQNFSRSGHCRTGKKKSHSMMAFVFQRLQLGDLNCQLTWRQEAGIDSPEGLFSNDCRSLPGEGWLVPEAFLFCFSRLWTNFWILSSISCWSAATLCCSGRIGWGC